VKATLLLEEHCETVLQCYFCREYSTASVRGADGWVTLPGPNYGLRDCCTECKKAGAKGVKR